MPLTEALRPGGTYILADYTYIHVEAVTNSGVRYRVLHRSWLGQRRVVTRTASATWLSGQVRAEVNGEFFPHLHRAAPYHFRHSAKERGGLAAFLAERAPHRPFSRGT